jgi:hypothetical protein
VKVSLVIGGSKGTWEEVAEASRIVGSCYGPFDEVVAVNDAGHDYPRVDHWVSFHGDKFERWKFKREEKGYPPVKNFWTSTYGRLESAYEKQLAQLGVKKVKYAGGGSSGLVAVIVALEYLRSSHVIVAGMPMDPQEGHYHSHGPWKEALRHRVAWEAMSSSLVPRVTSMSGWTQSVLGKPTASWLARMHEMRELELT